MVLTVSAMLKSSTPKFPETQRKILAVSPYKNQKQVNIYPLYDGTEKTFLFQEKRRDETKTGMKVSHFQHLGLMAR